MYGSYLLQTEAAYDKALQDLKGAGVELVPIDMHVLTELSERIMPDESLYTYEMPRELSRCPIMPSPAQMANPRPVSHSLKMDTHYQEECEHSERMSTILPRGRLCLSNALCKLLCCISKGSIDTGRSR